MVDHAANFNVGKFFGDLAQANASGALAQAHASTSDVAGVSASKSDVAGANTTAVAVVPTQKQQLNDGDLRKSCAYRVKYRIRKERWPIGALGVHPDNRGRVYPTPSRVHSLTVDLGRKGFWLYEADHNGCGVQDIPPANRSEVADRYPETFLEYNKRKVQGSELAKCFNEASSCHVGLLAHNHLLLVVLCFKHGAIFEWSEWDKQYLPLNDEGCLDLALCKDQENFQDLLTLVNEGMMTDVLSWKIHTEEPGACGLIAAALNSANSIAMSATMMEAVSVLSGECLVQTKQLGSVKIDFDVVREKVRGQLDTMVDDPDFADFFQAVINLGGDTADYIRDFVDFGAKFVDQKKRKLRMQTFGFLNKMDINKPLTKIAVLKRCCRKTPHNGYCPDPESVWGANDCPSLDSLERLLFFWHHDIRAVVAALPDPNRRAGLLANVDIHLTEAWYGCKSKTTIVRVREDLIKATQKYAVELKLHEKDLSEVLPAKDQWIDYRVKDSPSVPNVAAPKATAETKIMPKVIQFGEDGAALFVQDAVTDAKMKKFKVNLEAILPWKVWATTITEPTKEMRRSIAQRAAQTALSIMRRKHAHGDLPVEIFQDLRTSRKCVRTTAECLTGEIVLPPVSMNEDVRLPHEATSLMRVPITVRSLLVGEKGKSKGSGKDGKASKTSKKKPKKSAKEDKADKQDGDNDEGSNATAVDDELSTDVAVDGSSFTFFALYEWSQPSIDAALHLENAETNRSSVLPTDRVRKLKDMDPQRIHQCKEPKWVFPENTLCSMFPFWAVRRATDKGIEDEELDVNMGWEDKMVSIVGMSQVSADSCSETIEVTIPCLVNTKEVAKDTQLVVRIDDLGTEKKPSKLTWQNHRKRVLRQREIDQENALKKAAVAPLIKAKAAAAPSKQSIEI